MFACVDSFIYMFFSFIFFLSCHIVCLCVLFDDLFILAFASTLYRFAYTRGRHVHYRMVVRFTITYAISAYHLLRCDYESCSRRCVLDTTFCETVCQ
jgi:hypothetical protein